MAFIGFDFHVQPACFFITLLPVPAIAFENNLSAFNSFVSAYILQDFLRKILLTIDHIKIVLLSILSLLLFSLYLDLRRPLLYGKSLYIIGIVNIAASVPRIGYLYKKCRFQSEKHLTFALLLLQRVSGF